MLLADSLLGANWPGSEKGVNQYRVVGSVAEIGILRNADCGMRKVVKG